MPIPYPWRVCAPGVSLSGRTEKDPGPLLIKRVHRFLKVLWASHADALSGSRDAEISLRRVSRALARTGGEDLCLKYPGFEVDLQVTTTVHLMTRIWLGEADFRRAVGPGLLLRGSRTLARVFPGRFRLSQFADVRPMPPSTEA